MQSQGLGAGGGGEGDSGGGEGDSGGGEGDSEKSRMSKNFIRKIKTSNFRYGISFRKLNPAFYLAKSEK